jgi:tetratricopeptide (TPR) repeat protein
LTERLRFLEGSDDHARVNLEQLGVLCRDTWDIRAVLGDWAKAPLDAKTEAQIHCDLLDLALLWVDVKNRRGVHGAKAEIAHADAQAILAEAEGLLGPSPALSRERRRLGIADVQRNHADDRLAPWEHVIVARTLLRTGKLEQASEELDQAVQLRPQDFWANFYRGVCAYRRQRYNDAVHSFGVSIALAPESAECYYNRALASSALGQVGNAILDYDRALAIAPHWGAPALNRGVLHYQAGHLTEALSDLKQALRDRADPFSVHYNLALVLLASSQHKAALDHLDRALSHNQAHAQARSLRDLLLRRK